MGWKPGNLFRALDFEPRGTALPIACPEPSLFGTSSWAFMAPNPCGPDARPTNIFGARLRARVQRSASRHKARCSRARTSNDHNHLYRTITDRPNPTATGTFTLQSTRTQAMNGNTTLPRPAIPCNFRFLKNSVQRRYLKPFSRPAASSRSSNSLFFLASAWRKIRHIMIVSPNEEMQIA